MARVGIATKLEIMNKLVFKESVEVFESLSEDIWERLRDGARLKFSQREETITETLLLDLKRAMDKMGGKLRIVKVTPNNTGEESEHGCDWEWIIRYGASSKLPTHEERFLVQAKKLHQLHGNYDQMRHPVGKKIKRLQYNVLMDYAKKTKAVAMYALYNYHETAEARHFHCAYEPSPNPEELKQLGCTFVRAARLNDIISKPIKRTFDDLHNGITGVKPIPMRCLFHHDCLMERLLNMNEMFDDEDVRYEYVDGITIPIPFGCYVDRLISDFWLRKLEAEEDLSEINIDDLPEDFYPKRIEFNDGSSDTTSMRVYPPYICILDIAKMQPTELETEMQESIRQQ